MGGSQSKSEETKDIYENKPEEKVDDEKEKSPEEEEDEEDSLDNNAIQMIMHLLKKPIVDVARIKELLNKEGDAKVDLNTPDLPPTIDPNADPNDPHIIKLKERIAKKTYLGDYPIHLLVGRPPSQNTPELLDLVKFFYLKEAKMNCTNRLGSTPLHRACAAGNAPMVEKLIEWSANVNDVNNMNLTCLHMACYAGHTEVVKVLLAHGCAKHITFKCKYGIAPIDYVLRDDIMELLRNARTASKAAANKTALSAGNAPRVVEGDEGKHDE